MHARMCTGITVWTHHHQQTLPRATAQMKGQAKVMIASADGIRTMLMVALLGRSAPWMPD
eukprot:15454909-Alexandrium_andersonii.AAC.1